MKMKIGILDMDGTLLSRRSIDAFCSQLGLTSELRKIDELSSSLPAYKVSETIARLFKGQPKKILERIFDVIPLNEGASDFIEFLKNRGFQVAVATDSYEFLAERLRRRLGLDAVYGHRIEIRDGLLTGRLLTDHRCLAIPGCRDYSTCKLWFMRRLKSAGAEFTIAVGDSDSDFCVMHEVNVAIAYRPRSPAIAKLADFFVSDFAEARDILERRVNLPTHHSRTTGSSGDGR